MTCLLAGMNSLLTRAKWFAWKKRTLLLLVLYAFFLCGLFWKYHKEKIPLDDPFRLIAKICTDLAGVREQCPFITFSLGLVVPFVLTLLGGWTFKYHLVPGRKTQLIEALSDRCWELSEIASRRLERQMAEAAMWADGLRTGCDMSPKECESIAREVVEITPTKDLCATCLLTPDELYEQMKDFVETTAMQVRRSRKSLARYIVCDESALSDHKASVKWLLQIHSDCRVVLFHVDQEKFLEVADACQIKRNRLDVMLFSGRMVYWLDCNPTTLKVQTFEGLVRLFVTDEKKDIDAYTRLFGSLKSCARRISEPSRT